MADEDVAGTLDAEDEKLFEEMARNDEVDRAEAVREADEAARAEPEPEPAAEPEPEPDAANKQVPHAALHQEREKAKAATARAAELEQQVETLNNRFTRIMDEVVLPYSRKIQQEGGAQPAEPGQQPLEPAKPPVTYEEDPLAYLQWQTEHQQQEIAALRSGQQQQTQQSRAQGQIQAVLQDYATTSQQYGAENPDFADAYNHYTANLHRELELAGVTNPAERAQIAAQQEFAVIVAAKQRGANPAAVIHDLAVHRGFVARPAQDTGEGEAQATGGIGGAGAPAQQQPAPSPAEQKMTTLERGQAAASASANGAGADAQRPLDLVAIGRMSDAEFDSMFASDDPAKRDEAWNRMMRNAGGG